eukprot:TRINITY_DN11598_c0_g1_i2.p1 TRINITY_DN11598_c0_g1~~TRINITY_DN11598_c0_g1_i2.p1  ORF type:complete len:285 (+),score=38.85 TRINITY_DN11598_c0_g1_i2:91-855(+)
MAKKYRVKATHLRFFVLVNGELLWFARRNPLEPQGQIHLASARIRVTSKSIRVHGEHKLVCFYPTDPAALLRWTKALVKAVRIAQTNTRPLLDEPLLSASLHYVTATEESKREVSLHPHHMYVGPGAGKGEPAFGLMLVGANATPALDGRGFTVILQIDSEVLGKKDSYPPARYTFRCPDVTAATTTPTGVDAWLGAILVPGHLHQLHSLTSTAPPVNLDAQPHTTEASAEATSATTADAVAVITATPTAASDT